ncbi:MAG: ATP-binding protein [Fibrobacter sp.]|nr:ATP-binding protein [Fibrobacter sp.]
MNQEPLYIEFPSDADYIPAVRKFIADGAVIEGFSQKFSYRTEIIVDELCNNAVKYGPRTQEGTVKINCRFEDDALQLVVQDPGGQEQDLQKLRIAIDTVTGADKTSSGHGLEIVRMLSSGMELQQNRSGETIIKVMKKRSHED